MADQCCCERTEYDVSYDDHPDNANEAGDDNDFHQLYVYPGNVGIKCFHCNREWEIHHG